MRLPAGPRASCGTHSSTLLLEGDAPSVPSCAAKEMFLPHVEGLIYKHLVELPDYLGFGIKSSAVAFETRVE